ncbi:hypothetical protein BGZ57DRAFT_873206 [Hyaloscypha finlandica]|nr:hypothetical protein BGZ57DRAFT_873206 [Hyaloscypha finlandica]
MRRLFLVLSVALSRNFGVKSNAGSLTKDRIQQLIYRISWISLESSTRYNRIRRSPPRRGYFVCSHLRLTPALRVY